MTLESLAITYNNIVFSFDAFIGNSLFLCSIFAFSFFFKMYVLVKIISSQIKGKVFSLLPLFFGIMLFGAAVHDLSWVAYTLADHLQVGSLSLLNSIPRAFMRIAWALIPVQYHALSLFLETLTTKKINWRHQILFFIITTILFIVFIFCAITKPYIRTSADEILLQKIASIYAILVLVPIHLGKLLFRIRKTNLPRLITYQLKIFTLCILIPYWVCDLLQFLPLDLDTNFITNSYTFLSLSNLLLIGAIIYCSHRVIGLRFLNMSHHVEGRPKAHFVDEFKATLEQLSRVTSLEELTHITRAFCKEILQIPLLASSLTIRGEVAAKHTTESYPAHKNNELIETFIQVHHRALLPMLATTRILIRDEIAFNNFYAESEAQTVSLAILEQSETDILLPIFYKDQLVAFITVEQNARTQRFYNNTKRDQLIIFANYMGNIIYLLKSKDIDSIVEKTNQLERELYQKHQEVNQYKESIRSFLRTTHERAVGIILYKNNQFTFTNKAAKELIPFDPKLHAGHHLSKALLRLVKQCIQYKTTQTINEYNDENQPLVLSAVPSLDSQQIIITIGRPEISDIIKKQIDVLKNPSDWDYLLYLETTESGRLINRLIPGSGEQLLAFKIELLKASLGTSATLLTMPENDAHNTIALIHQISLREKIHTLTLTAPDKTISTGIALFGIDPLFGTMKEEPIIKRLSPNGTLVIKNIERLDHESQRHLAECISYNMFRPIKGKQKTSCNVRIICTSTLAPQALITENYLCPELHQSIKQYTVRFPSLETLPKEELYDLIIGIERQTSLDNPLLQKLYGLPTRQIEAIIKDRPTSLLDLKERVSARAPHDTETTTGDNDSYKTMPPDIAHALTLGKSALKNKNQCPFYGITLKIKTELPRSLALTDLR